MSEMPPDPEQWPFVGEGAQDAIESGAHGFAQLVLALSPGPSVIGAALSLMWQKTNENRLNLIIKSLREEVALALATAHASGERVEGLSAILEDEQERLIPLMETVFNRMRETSDDGKHERLRRSLATALSNPADKEHERFVRLVCRYEELEVFILQELSKFSAGTPRMMEDAPGVLLQAIPYAIRSEYTAAQIRAMMTTLEADGLVETTPENPLQQVSEGAYQRVEKPSVGMMILDRGSRFIEFLATGDARHPASAP